MNLKNFPWIVFCVLMGVGGLSLLALLSGFLNPLAVAGLGAFGFVWLEYKSGMKNIPAKPPHVGVLTFWGRRTMIVLSEGDHLMMPYWPFFIDFIPIKVEKINVDDEPIPDIICKAKGPKKKIPGAGGRLTAFFSYTFTPDPKRLMQYINSGEEKGVRAIIENQISEIVRQKGREMTWEEFQFSGDVLTAEMVVRLSGDKPPQLKRIPGKENELEKTSDGKYQETGERLEVSKCIPEEIKYFLEQKVRGESSYADVQDLGVVIHRANIEKFELGKDLKEAAERMAREEQERGAEIYEVETETKQAQILFKAYEDAGTPQTLEACVLEIRRRKAQREGKDVKTLEIPGLTETATAIGTGLAALGAGLAAGLGNKGGTNP